MDLLRVGAKVGLVITDHLMPGMSGLELARIIEKNWPEIPVVLASGYADLPASVAGPELRLAKPYQPQELAACIRQAIRGGNIVSLGAARRA